MIFPLSFSSRSVNTFSANIAKSSSSSRNTLSVLPSKIETTIGFSIQVLRFAKGLVLGVESGGWLMESHIGSSSSSATGSTVYCKHNEACATNTSGTRKNPGRKFYYCRHWKDKSVDCGFFKWVDVVNK
ncbi:hypothetical protein LINPERPRIM_LOCUS8355 [Linum perenne]